MNFEDLKGLTFVDIKVSDDEIRFVTDTGRTFEMLHYQSCCESVYIESIVGEIQYLLNTPILMAEEATNDDTDDECGMWTFYKLATIKGYVDIRWYGSSNGYYSVSVDFREV